jgi:phytoene synthase
LAQHGVTREMLEKRTLTPAIVDALRFQIARVRQLEEQSRQGIAMLDASAQPCIETARILYCGIVQAVEDLNYDVFNKRATVPLSRRLKVAIPAWYKARKLWRASPPDSDADFLLLT